MADKVHLVADGSVQAFLAKARSDEGAPNSFCVIGYSPEKKMNWWSLLRKKAA